MSGFGSSRGLEKGVGQCGGLGRKWGKLGKIMRKKKKKKKKRHARRSPTVWPTRESAILAGAKLLRVLLTRTFTLDWHNEMYGTVWRKESGGSLTEEIRVADDEWPESEMTMSF